MIQLTKLMPETNLCEMKVYHGTISDFVDVIEKSGKLVSQRTGTKKISGGLTTEAGLIWVTPEFNIANQYAHGWELKMHGPDVLIQKGLKADYGGVFEIELDDSLKLIDRHAPLNQEQVNILNDKFVPHYKPLKVGDSLSNAEWRTNNGQLHDMVLALGYDGVTYSKGKQIGIAVDSLPIKVLHKKPFKTNEELSQQDKQHDEFRIKTGFWGSAAAGCLIMARTTGRLLIQKRGEVEEPGTWGTWGGAIDEGDTPQDTIYKEFEEETGMSSNEIVELIPLHIFKHPSGFRYHNFLVVVDDEFNPYISNDSWEIEGYKWVRFGQWPEPMHFGLKELLRIDGNKIRNVVNNNMQGKKLTEGVSTGDVKLHPSLKYNQLKNKKTVTAYHASESPNLIPDNDMTMHVGSLQQAMDLMHHMKKQLPNLKFYVYEMTVELGKLAPYLFDEDPDKKVGGGTRDYSYDTYAYMNRIEFSKGVKMGDNISLMLARPEQQILNKKIVLTR